MISVLAQERVLGVALGSAIMGAIVFEQRKRIYNSILDPSQVASKSKTREPIFAKKNSLRVSTLMEQGCGSDIRTCDRSS